MYLKGQSAFPIVTDNQQFERFKNTRTQKREDVVQEKMQRAVAWQAIKRAKVEHHYRAILPPASSAFGRLGIRGSDGGEKSNGKGSKGSENLEREVKIPASVENDGGRGSP